MPNSKFTSPAMKDTKYTDQKLLELIKENSDYLKYVYKNTKSYSLRFMKKMTSNNNVSDEVLENIYHDAVIVLYEKIRDGKFELTSSFQTYINSVCRFRLLNKFKEIKKDIERNLIVLKDEKGSGQQYDDSITDTLDPIPNLEEKKFRAMEKAMIDLKEAGGNCFEILTLFWYKKKSMNAIAEHFGYNNAATAKNLKAKCQKRLKKLAFKYLKE